jgi:hypothetical protein
MGPFMFLLFVNDLTFHVKDPCAVALFADDAKIYSEIQTLTDQIFLNIQLERIHQWGLTWRMNFNTNKCYVLSVSNKSEKIMPNYMLGTKILENVNEFVDLGVKVNSNLSWSNHISDIKGKAMRNLGYIKRTLGMNVSLEAKKVLYLTLVRSVISYCTQLWCPCSKRDIIRLESVQRQATAYLLNNTDLSYVNRLEQCSLLPLSYMREVYDLILFYNMYHDRLAVDFGRYFTVDHTLRRGRSAHSTTGVIARRFRTERCRSFFTNRVLWLWESLPEPVRNIPPPVSVKSKPISYKNALMEFYTNKL